jgi:tetratricopeptide (TPR) repeat protein
VKYYSRALKLDPSYEPGWILKAAALIQLTRFAEAIVCYDHVLETCPNATTWFKKGICCHHLKRSEEAISCFDKALAVCEVEDHQLFEEISRHRKAVEEELQHRIPTEGLVS